MPSNKKDSLYMFQNFNNLPETSFGRMDENGKWIFTGVVYIAQAPEIVDENGKPTGMFEQYNTITIPHRQHSCFNAALDLSTGVYPIFEVGFSSYYTLQQLQDGPKQRERAAIVDGSHYNGAYRDYIQGQREGIWTLTWNKGTFLYERLQNDSEPNEGEPESVTKKRRTYWKHTYMDLILNGDPIKIVYNWKEAAPLQYIVERARLFAIDDLAARRLACVDGLNGYLDAKAGHKIDRKVEAGENVLVDKKGEVATHVEEFHTRKLIEIASMPGKRFQIYRWYSQSKTIDITEENLEKEVGIILAGKGTITVKQVKASKK
jgi:hypothetical protein